MPWSPASQCEVFVCTCGVTRDLGPLTTLLATGLVHHYVIHQTELTVYNTSIIVETSVYGSWSRCVRTICRTIFQCKVYHPTPCLPSHAAPLYAHLFTVLDPGALGSPNEVFAWRHMCLSLRHTSNTRLRETCGVC